MRQLIVYPVLFSALVLAPVVTACGGATEGAPAPEGSAGEGTGGSGSGGASTSGVGTGGRATGGLSTGGLAAGGIVGTGGVFNGGAGGIIGDGGAGGGFTGGAGGVTVCPREETVSWFERCSTQEACQAPNAATEVVGAAVPLLESSGGAPNGDIFIPLSTGGTSGGTMPTGGAPNPGVPAGGAAGAPIPVPLPLNPPVTLPLCSAPNATQSYLLAFDSMSQSGGYESFQIATNDDGDPAACQGRELAQLWLGDGPTVPAGQWATRCFAVEGSLLGKTVSIVPNTDGTEVQNLRFVKSCDCVLSKKVQRYDCAIVDQTGAGGSSTCM